MSESKHTCKQASKLFLSWCGVRFRSDQMYIFFPLFVLLLLSTLMMNESGGEAYLNRLGNGS
jgi:hypothetical protein